MTDEQRQTRAKAVFDKLVKMLEQRDWHFEKQEEDLLIRSGVKTDDLPVEFIMIVNPRQEVVQFLSKMPFSMSEEKRMDGAIAVCVANYGLCDGSFDYNIANGDIIFRLTTSYTGDTVLSDDLLEYMILVASNTVDDYNDKFFMLSKGVMKLQQFIQQENGG